MEASEKAQVIVSSVIVVGVLLIDIAWCVALPIVGLLWTVGWLR